MSSDIWNPWHGCRKYSEGCDHCYMHYLDNERGKSGGEIYKVKTNSNLSTQPSENHVFSRLFACVILKSYVFSLVFSLMSENKGNFLLFAADYLIQQPCGSTLRFPCSVSVDIHCGTDISVSEKLLHILWCCSI